MGLNKTRAKVKPKVLGERESLLSEIARKYGTPVHVLDLGVLENNVRAFRNSLDLSGIDYKVAYSVKTNYLPVIMRAMAGWDIGADVVSGYELEAALKHGFVPENIVFNGPMKLQEELERAARLGIMVNIDGLYEVEILQKVGRTSNKVIDVGVRVNPGINLYPSDDPSYNILSSVNAARSKFGWPLNDAKTIVDLIHDAKFLRLRSLHCHFGSQITDVDIFLSAVCSVLDFVTETTLLSELAFINIGGGFGVPGIVRDRAGPLQQLKRLSGEANTVERAKFSMDTFAEGLRNALVLRDLEHLTVVCEPGRILVSDAMCLVTRVVSVKGIDAGRWVILDGGLNLLPTAGPSEEHLFNVIGRSSSPLENMMVGGPLCYEGDVFSYSHPLPVDTDVGDYVAISDSGAYSVSRSTNFIRPRAPVAAVSGRTHKLCWRRETRDDIFSFEDERAYSLIESSGKAEARAKDTVSTASILDGRNKKVIWLWATPRSISTAFTKAIGQSDSIVTIHEPFSNCYYFGEDRRSSRYGEIRELARIAGKHVNQQISEIKDSTIFVKELAFQGHFYVDNQLLDDATNTFIIRHPMQTMASLLPLKPDFTEEEFGYTALLKILDYVRFNQRNEVIVVDGERFRNRPESTLREYCERVGIIFEPSMLSWAPGPYRIWRECERNSQQQWHKTLEQSTEIVPSEPRSIEIPAQHVKTYRRAADIYSTLSLFAL